MTATEKPTSERGRKLKRTDQPGRRAKRLDDHEYGRRPDGHEQVRVRRADCLCQLGHCEDHHRESQHAHDRKGNAAHIEACEIDPQDQGQPGCGEKHKQDYRRAQRRFTPKMRDDRDWERVQNRMMLARLMSM